MIIGVSRRDEDVSKLENKSYTDAEKALNAYVRNHFPEWNCKEV